MKLFRYFCQEVMRVISQPWIWLSVFLICGVDFLVIFSSPQVYQLLVNGHKADLDMLSLFYMNRWENFISFTRVSICGFPFIAHYIQDTKSRKIENILLRTKSWRYAAASVLVVVLGSFSCLFLGNLLFYLISHYGVGIALWHNSSSSFVTSILLEAGHRKLFFLVDLARESLLGAFYSLIAFGVSIFVSNVSFVTVLPTVLFYFNLFMVNALFLPIPMWLDPREIFLGDWGAALFHGDDIKQCICAGTYLLVFMILTAVLLYGKIVGRVRK
jgi:hypothetical protein